VQIDDHLGDVVDVRFAAAARPSAGGSFDDTALELAAILKLSSARPPSAVAPVTCS
jgi:hypothetical protein